MNIKIECCICGKEFSTTIWMRSVDDIVAMIDPTKCECCQPKEKLKSDERLIKTALE